MRWLRATAAGRAMRSRGGPATSRGSSSPTTSRSVCASKYNDALMRHAVAAAAAALILFRPLPARAQEPPPPIGPFVLDVHATVPRFPTEDQQLAASRGLSIAQLPGSGLGVQIGAHVYYLRVKVITFGIGAEVAAGRSRQAGSTLNPLATEER